MAITKGHLSGSHVANQENADEKEAARKRENGYISVLIRTNRDDCGHLADAA